MGNGKGLDAVYEVCEGRLFRNGKALSAARAVFYIQELQRECRKRDSALEYAKRTIKTIAPNRRMDE